MLSRLLREYQRSKLKGGKMDKELKHRKHWLDALRIAEILFEYEGYHIRYLKDLERFIIANK
ncbi:hypothetical protein ES703_110943 [subsurface metagenome]